MYEQADKRSLILTGDKGAYQATDGAVVLYAVPLVDGKPKGRLHYFKTVAEGDVFADYGFVKTQHAVWACVAKSVDGGRWVGVDPALAVDGADGFSLFVGTLEEALDKEAVLFDARRHYADRILSKAATRLAAVNTRLSVWSEDEFAEEDPHVQVCRILCRYLKVEPKTPAKDIAGAFGNIAEEILYLSGIRYKVASLAEDWWKHNNGAMLGYWEDGTPVAILPRKITGYRVYDPTRGVVRKIDAAVAAKIKPEATAVFRTLPTGKLGLKEIVAFILGENIYKEMAVIALCSLLANVVQVIPPIVAEQIFDVIVPENMRHMMIEVILILIAFELANVGFSIIVNLGIARIHTKGGLSLQAALWDRLLALPVPFFNKYTTGELLQKIKGIDQAKDLISMENLQVIFANLFSFINVMVLFNFSATITPYVLLMFLCLFVVYGVAYKKKYALHKRYMDLENKAMRFSHQCVRGIHRVKVSCAEARVFNIWSAYESDKRNVASKIKMIDIALGSFQLFFDFTSTAAVYLLIAQIHDVAMGLFIAYISTFLIFQKSMRKLLKALNMLPELVSVCMNVKPILDAEPEYGTLKIIPKDLSATLEVNHATFRYGEYGRTILNGVSFRVEEGESIGIVGFSGGGKSTLLKVLMGFYGLAGGKIYYGGYDLETIDLRYLRKQMGVVLQNGRLIVGDIYSNVTDNDGSVSPAAVTEALRMVGLAERVKTLPDGMYTRLENCPLSDGERQRLLIARAIANKKKFLFLDEATSSLDNLSQSAILKNLRNIPATKIIVAQRLSTVRYCDKIIVIDKGKIVGQGAYEAIAGEHALFRQTAK